MEVQTYEYGYAYGRQVERRLIAEQLRREAALIESFAAPGKAVQLVAFLIDPPSPDSGEGDQ